MFAALSDTGMTERSEQQRDSMMGMPITHISMKGKLYVNTLEGELQVLGKTAKLELLSQEGEILQVLTGTSQDGDGMVHFVLEGEVPSAQYYLTVEK